MKIKLLLSFFAISTVGFSQHQINSFYGINNTTYMAMATNTPLNHGNGGTDQTWVFNSFLPLGTSTYTYAAPTTTESSTYPGTTDIIVSTSVEGSTTTVGKMLTKNNAGAVSITGITASGMVINFNGGSNGSGNATLGTFPMIYPATNTDNTVSGNFSYGTNSGTFSGTLTTTVDAYGTLGLPEFTYNGNVTRLKTVLSVTLYVSIFPVGTASQTSYAYYDPSNSSNNFILRSVNTVITAAAAGINENNTTIEILHALLLGNNQHELQSVWIKNPVQDSLEINSDQVIENADISITDMMGKIIYQARNQNINGRFEIPALINKGIYLIKIANEKGSISKKIIKS